MTDVFSHPHCAVPSHGDLGIHVPALDQVPRSSAVPPFLDFADQPNVKQGEGK